MAAPTTTWGRFAPLPPIDPAKRARAIREAIAKRRIKYTKEIDDILMLLDEIVGFERIL